jgi:uncharacterized membrane protein (DUF441 family)
MRILKHMEAVFIVALGVACSASYLADGVPAAHAQPHIADAAAIATSGKMAVVTVTAKRPSVAEKQELLLAERRQVGSRM